MAWEFPAVSQSRIEFWKQPQYTRKGMLLFTIMFGFFGLHHFLLRSPQTGLLFFLANIFTLGYCYFYDIIQLASTPVQELNTYGMSLPWGPAGIAKGMWVCGDSPPCSTAPNPWWFFAYALLLPFAPLAKLITGDSSNALIGFLNLTVMPLGWIILGLTNLFEYFKLFFKPADLFMFGIDRAFPYTMLGWDKRGNNQRITGKEPSKPTENQPSESDNQPFYIRWWKITMEILGPIIQALIPPQVAIAIGATSLAATQGAKTAESVLKTAEVVSEQAQSTISSAGQVAKKIANLATSIPDAATGALAKASQMSTDLGSLKSNGLNTKALQVLQGGGNDSSYFDYAILGILGAVLGGGFLLHTGRTFADVLHTKYGPNDAPP